MAETTSNIEMAHRIHEQGHHHHDDGPPSRRKELIEIFEAIVLAAVAILTAWSGYQAARWDAKSSAAYAAASGTTVKAQEQQTLAGQDHLYDIVTFGSWLQATHRGEKDLAAKFERRFRPEYATAFAAWMRTNPFENTQAPAGPSFVPEYRNAHVEASHELARQAQELYERGVATRETGDDYIRITVILATVLLLTALSQRFKVLAPRVGLLVVACVMLVFAIFYIATFPRA
jgi:hypothetical protein